MSVYTYKNNKNIFNKHGGRCRDVKTQKACEHLGALIELHTYIIIYTR